MGVVGTGLVQALSQRTALLRDQAGLPLRLTRVLVRDHSRPRGVELPPGVLTDDPAAVIEDPATQVVVELMGGEEPAHRYVRHALQAGRSVVTANKELMAKHGAALQELAREQGVALLFEGAVGGGIPLIATFRRGLAATRITAVRAIINGTTNYILTRMAQDGLDFPTALARAQALGYAERDPQNDVEGVDAAYKLAILATLAFRTPVSLEDVYYEGIGRLTAKDFRYAQELGYTIKLLAIAKEEEGVVQARVHPAFLRQEMLLAKVDGVYNAVQVDGDLVGELLFYGQGAGAQPTTSAVLSDILEISRDLVAGRPLAFHPPLKPVRHIRPVEEIAVRYYIRMSVADRAGVLAQIARVLGESGISIASVIQKETDDAAQTAEIVIMTHRAREAAMRQATGALQALDVVKEIGTIVRVEE
ncbi:MAG: homoserine dehydrogenase [Chloroflexi bacterium]|nr:homoserine dehydrogenase [Chloroflexota bacterium]